MTGLAELQRYVDEHVRCSHADIRLAEFSDGVLHVRLEGACGGCPGAPATVEELLRGSLMQAFPDVKRIEVEQRVSGELLDFAKKLLGEKNDRK